MRLFRTTRRLSVRSFSVAILRLGLWGAQAGTITGTFSLIPQATSIDLTQEGASDWVHWGLYDENSINRKSGVPAMIGDYELVQAFPTTYVVAYRFDDHFNGFSWYDGWPRLAQTNTTTGVWAYQAWPLNPVATGMGFRISAPADTATRILKVYVGAYQAQGRLRATLSDGGLAYTDTSLFNVNNGPGAVYTLTYQANSPGQTLTVEWILFQRASTNSTEANVTLEAAALTLPAANNPPLVSLNTPANLQAFAAPATIALSASASDFDGSVTNVSFYEGTNLLGQIDSAPYNFNWSNVSPGIYSMKAMASDNGGATRSSLLTKVYVHGTGGALATTASPSPFTVDLTSEGTADWVHLGSVTNTTVERKGGVVPQISVSSLGTNELGRFANGQVYYSWTDGVPTLVNSGTASGIFVYGYGNGFRLSAPADTTPRKLRVYLGGYGVRATFEAYLSDLSAPPFAETSVDTVYDNVNYVFDIDYQAASDNQQLIVLFQAAELYDQLWGNVNFQAATLQGGAPAGPYIKSVSMGATGLILKFDTESGRSYTVQHTDALGTGSWNTLATVPGTGGEVTVEDPNIIETSRFYRVLSQ